MTPAYYLGTKTAAYKSALDEADYGGAAVGLGSGFGLHNLIGQATNGVDDKLRRAQGLSANNSNRGLAAELVRDNTGKVLREYQTGAGRYATLGDNSAIKKYPGLGRAVTTARRAPYDQFRNLQGNARDAMHSFSQRGARLGKMTSRLKLLNVLRQLKNPLAVGAGLGAGALATMGLRGAE